MKLFTLLSIACLAGTANAHVTELSEDFFIIGPKESIRKPVTDSFLDEDCRAKIKETVCLREGELNSREVDAPCLSGTEKYVPVFEKVYDQFPPVLQKMFCSVKKIYIEKALKSTAYASVGLNAIGMRQSLIDENLDLAKWATWKEQLSFGGQLFSYAVKADLPSYSTTSKENEFVYNVTAHEFGHLFDFANDLNSGFLDQHYAGLSWKNMVKPKDEFDYPNRSKICFYDCGSKKLGKEVVPQVYEDLFEKTNFLNTYTSRNPREDFADTFAFYIMFTERPDSTYVFDTKQGKTYDVRQSLFSKRMKDKVEYIKAFLAKPDILYP